MPLISPIEVEYDCLRAIAPPLSLALLEVKSPVIDFIVPPRSAIAPPLPSAVFEVKSPVIVPIEPPE